MTLTTIKKAGLDELALDHVFTIGASGSSAYTFQGEGLNGTVNNPTLYLTRGKTYRFENGSGGHPIRIQSTSGASGTAYNTGVTNNAGSGTVIVEVQHDAPDVLYYQCTSHAAMNGILYITGALADGGVTTAKIATDAVTQPKIAASAIHTENINDNAVTTAKIADDAVTSAKIADGTIINGNIAADTIQLTKIQEIATNHLLGRNTSGTGNPEILGVGQVRTMLNVADGATNSPTTTINNNADNRLITGSGTANTLEGEQYLTWNGSTLGLQKSGSGDVAVNIEVGNGISQSRLLFSDSTAVDGTVTYDHNDRKLYLGAGTSSPTDGDITIDSSGRVGIGLSNPDAYDSWANQLVVYGAGHSGITIRGNYADTGNIYFADGTSGGEKYAGYIQYNHPVSRMSFGTATANRLNLTNDGLCFNSDTAAANALDDYEEGSFTPTMKSSDNNPTFSYSHQRGKYVKVGRLVTVWIFIYATIGGTETGNLYIEDLPFTVRDEYAQILITDSGQWDSFPSNHSGWGGYAQLNDNHVVMLSCGDKTAGGVHASHWGTNTYLYATMSYMTDT